MMYKLGVTACRWDEGFGASCNIRQSMMVGRHQPVLDPDKPAVLTFYVPFHRPGLPVKNQVTAGRAELFYTGYADYEKQILQQMNTLFAATGFVPKKRYQGHYPEPLGTCIRSAVTWFLLRHSNAYGTQK